MGCRASYVPLGEIAKFESGGTPSKKNKRYWDGSIPWISAKTLVGDTVYESDLAITKEGLEAGSKLAPKGSLLLLTRGSGLFKRIPLAIAGKEVAFNQDIKCVNSAAKGISNRYLFYALTSLEPSISAMLETTGIGAGKLATDRLKALPVPVLDEAARDKVTHFADCIYRKIHLNTKLNGYLVKACDVLYSNYAAGEQAAEWPMGTLEDLLEIRYGKDHKKLNDGNIPVYGSGGYMRSVDRFLYSGESVLIPRKGSLNNVMYVREKFWTVDTMFYAVPKSPNVAKYAYQFIKRLDLASMNSGSAVPSMTTKILNALPVPIPPKESLHAFDDQLQPYYSAICANAIENELLAALRDALLPKLMSGEIDVSKVDLTQLNSHLAETLRPFGCHILATQKRGGPHPCEPPRAPGYHATAPIGTTPLLPK